MTTQLKDSCDFVTVVTMDVDTGKLYRVINGEISKTPAANNASGTGVTHHVPDAQSLSNLLVSISTQTNCALILGYIAGTEPTLIGSIGEPYRLMSSRNFDELVATHNIKGDKFASKPIVVDGTKYATRTKRMFSPSTWFGFDRDVVEGMPDQLEPKATFGRWLEMLNIMIPEIRGCSYVAVKSASCRVVYNGKPMAETNIHVYMQAREAKDTERFGKAGMVHSFARGFGFMRPVKDRTTGAAIGQRPWTLYDPTTFSRERLFFDGSPILDPNDPAVIMGQLYIEPTKPVVFNGGNGRVNTRALPLPSKAEQKSWDLEIEVDSKGRVTIVNTTDLTPEIEFDYHDRATGERGTMTMLDFVNGDVDRLSCQSVFRPDSESFAAYVSKENDCHPFMYDVGTNINYKYNNVRLKLAESLGIPYEPQLKGYNHDNIRNEPSDNLVVGGGSNNITTESDTALLESESGSGRESDNGTIRYDRDAGGVNKKSHTTTQWDQTDNPATDSRETLERQTQQIGPPPPPREPLTIDQVGVFKAPDLSHLTNDVSLDSHTSGIKKGFSIAESFSIGATLDSVSTEFGETDLGNANRFANMFSETLKYVPIYKCWFRWRGTRWEKCEGVDARSAAHELVGIMSAHANQLADDAPFRKWAKTSGSSNSIGAMVREAMQIPQMVITTDQIDNNWYNFGVANGYIDLRLQTDGGADGAGTAGTAGTAGDINRLVGYKEPDPSLFITKGSDVCYESTATCPVWDKTLFDIFSGDVDLIRFFQIFAGYSMMGKPEHEVLAFLVGGGSNGKSTVIGVLEKIFGDYKATVDKKALMRGRDSDGQAATPAIARLKGIRLAIVTETQEGDVIDESVIKSLSGSDTITARHLHGDTFDFDATFVSWIATNHRPNIRSTDDGTWRRVMQFPFVRNFEKELGKKNLDTGLKQRIIDTELSGVLNWCLKGIEMYESDGLIPPASVVAATEEYREEQDILANWMTSALDIGSSFEVSNLALWRSYETFALAHGDKIIHNSRTLNGKIAAKGFAKLTHLRNDNSKRGFSGLRVKLIPTE